MPVCDDIRVREELDFVWLVLGSMHRFGLIEIIVQRCEMIECRSLSCDQRSEKKLVYCLVTRAAESLSPHRKTMMRQIPTALEFSRETNKVTEGRASWR